MVMSGLAANQIVTLPEAAPDENEAAQVRDFLRENNAQAKRDTLLRFVEYDGTITLCSGAERNRPDLFEFARLTES